MIEPRFERDVTEVLERAPAIISMIEANTDPAVWATLTPAQKDEALRRSLVVLGKLLRLAMNWTN